MAPPVVFSNIAIPPAATASRTSTVGEPSLASSGQVALFSGNWYAAQSFDGGATWNGVDPFTFFPPVDGGFCCDQTLIYEPTRDLFVWLVQYVVRNKQNTLRVAVCSGNEVQAGSWKLYDFTPTSVDHSWTDEWFDYNHAATSGNFLYVGSNMFAVDPEEFRRSIILRLSLDELQAKQPLTVEFFTAADFSLRCTLGAEDVMYFGAHAQNDAIRVFSWPEAAGTATSVDIKITPWAPPPFSAPHTGSGDWMGRGDSRVTAGWFANGRLGFLWTANRQGAARPLPFVRAVRIDANTMTLVDEPDIWSRSAAFAWVEACPNNRGDLAVSLFTGGATLHPSHVIGIRSPADTSWGLSIVTQGSDSPSDGKWGDYLHMRPSYPDAGSWVASAFTLQGGGARINVEPRFVHFGVPAPATTAAVA